MKTEKFDKLVPCRNKPVIRAEYNRNGYTVLSVLSVPRRSDHVIEIYTAGNHRQDSGQSASPGSPDALPLRTLRTYAIRTAREMAAESKQIFAGCQRVPDLL